MSSLTLVWKNLMRAKLRTALTLIAIFIAFVILGVLRSFEGAINSGVELAAANRLVVINRINFTQPLPYAYVNRVRNVEDVRLVTFAVWMGAYYKEPRNFIVGFAVDPGTYLASLPELIVGDEDKAAFLADRRGVLVGERLAKQWGIAKGDLIPIGSNIWSKSDGSQIWDMKVSGIFTGRDKQTDTSFLIFHYDYLNESRSFGRDMIGWLIVTTASPEKNEAVAQRIDALFENTPYRTKTDTEQAFSQAFINQIGDIGLIISSVVGAALFTILMIVGNTMVLAIRERTPEIAVLKTIGFSGPRIFTMVLGESVLMALMGGIPGMLIAALFIKGASEQMAGTLPNLVMSGQVMIEAGILMLVLGLITGAMPAVNALRLDIVTGLGRR